MGLMAFYLLQDVLEAQLVIFDWYQQKIMGWTLSFGREWPWAKQRHFNRYHSVFGFW